MKPRKVIVLGATGTIGRRTLEVLHALHQEDASWECVGLSCGTQADAIIEAAKSWPDAKTATVVDDSRVDYSGEDASLQLIDKCAGPDTLVVSAIVGSAGLRPTLRAIESGATIALANKEVLVCAGALVQQMLDSSGGKIWPVDSEHAAIAQCLRGVQANDVKSIILTASGGPFRKTPLAEFPMLTPAQALNHPVWNMGPRITIDSATMANKALELIEAHHLFRLQEDQLDVLVHPGSTVHGLVHLHDGTTLMQLGAPDMASPIRWAMTGGAHDASIGSALDPMSLTELNFSAVDHARFPFVELGRQVIRSGGGSGCVLNAADEICVQAFLQNRISYQDIYNFVADAVERFGSANPSNLTEILELDDVVRDDVSNRLP